MSERRIGGSSPRPYRDGPARAVYHAPPARAPRRGDAAVLEKRQRDLQGLAHAFSKLLVALHLLVRPDRALLVLLGRGLRFVQLLAQIVALLAQQVLLAGESRDLLPRLLQLGVEPGGLRLAAARLQLIARGGQLAFELLRRRGQGVGALLQ